MGIFDEGCHFAYLDIVAASASITTGGFARLDQRGHLYSGYGSH